MTKSSAVRETIDIGRRGFLVANATLALGGCVHCTFPAPIAPGVVPVGDSHAHFFNAADLPVAGFAKFVLIPRYVPNFPQGALALVDIIAWVMKALTLTAAEELRQIGTGSLSTRSAPTPADFGREAATAHQRGLKGLAPVGEVDALEDPDDRPHVSADERVKSHQALAELLGTRRRQDIGGGRAIDASVFERIASEEIRTSSTPSSAPDGLQCPAASARAEGIDASQSVRAMLRWIYLMCRPRCMHVEEYLKAIARHGQAGDDPGYQVTEAINLLVDYDKWLHDAPRPGSEQPSQVAYWTRYADVAAQVTGRIRLHTFAGYDPLRHAEERVLENRTTTFDALRQWARDGRDPTSLAPRRIAGFKVYPPMGFRPDRNERIDHLDQRGGIAILKRWKRIGIDRIGPEIDISLDSFFDFCTDFDVPVLTHARESNIALPEHGDDPSPTHWLALVEKLAAKYPGRKPLRLSLGHFDLVNCPGDPIGDRNVMTRALELNHAHRARMYFDIGFDDRILAGQGRLLLAEMADICEKTGDAGDYVMFGSDWIMLANQVNAGEYLDLAYQAARAVPFWERRMEKLFGGNLRRFLDPMAM